MFKRTLDLGLTSKEKRKWPCIQFYNRRCTNCDYPEGGKLSKCMKKRKFISLLLIYDLQLNIVSVFSEYYCLTLGQSAHLSAWCPPQSTFSPLILGTQFEFFQAQSPLHWYLNQIRRAIICESEILLHGNVATESSLELQMLSCVAPWLSVTFIDDIFWVS